MEELRSAPDGRFFVFSAKRDGGGNNLYRIDADGANLKQLTFGDSYEVDSTVSPDGNWIVYESFSLDGGERKSILRKISSDGGMPQLFSDITCHTPHFSPDGESISCVSADWKKVSILSAENGATLKTLETEENSILNIGARWTPDGKAISYIVVRKNIGNIRIHPLDGQPSRALTDFTSGDIYNFTFSSDGKKIIIARGYQTRNAVLVKFRP
jgi:Tol biopolymer transport system component